MSAKRGRAWPMSPPLAKELVETLSKNAVNSVKGALAWLLINSPHLLKESWSLDQIEEIRHHLVCAGLSWQQTRWDDVFDDVRDALKETPAKASSRMMRESYQRRELKLPAGQRRTKLSNILWR